MNKTARDIFNMPPLEQKNCISVLSETEISDLIQSALDEQIFETAVVLKNEQKRRNNEKKIS